MVHWSPSSWITSLVSLTCFWEHELNQKRGVLPHLTCYYVQWCATLVYKRKACISFPALCSVTLVDVIEFLMGIYIKNVGKQYKIRTSSQWRSHVLIESRLCGLHFHIFWFYMSRITPWWHLSSYNYDFPIYIGYVWIYFYSLAIAMTQYMEKST